MRNRNDLRHRRLQREKNACDIPSDFTCEIATIIVITDYSGRRTPVTLLQTSHAKSQPSSSSPAIAATTSGTTTRTVAITRANKYNWLGDAGRQRGDNEETSRRQPRLWASSMTPDLRYDQDIVRVLSSRHRYDRLPTSSIKYTPCVTDYTQHEFKCMDTPPVLRITPNTSSSVWTQPLPYGLYPTRVREYGCITDTWDYVRRCGIEGSFSRKAYLPLRGRYRIYA
jgi:hypothetical protein